MLTSLFSYSQVISIENWYGDEIAGAYYKDVNNVLDGFEGTYRYTNNNDTLVIVFKKFVNTPNPMYSQDVLAGEMKYVKNGVLKFDNLSKINDNLSNRDLHHLSGNSILKTFNPPPCEGCSPNEKRVKLYFVGGDNLLGGNMVLQKITEAGQPEKLKIYILYDNRLIVVGEPEPPFPIIPWGEYILTRID